MFTSVYLIINCPLLNLYINASKPNDTIIFSASQSGKYSVTLHFRSREVRFPVQCQKFLVECGKNLVEYGKNVRTPLIYSFHSYFKIKVSIRYFNLV
jgi:hypothetical protein